MTIRVLIADDDPEVRSTLTDLVVGEPGLKLTGAARDADEAIDLAKEHSPDVVLLDVRMPKGGGARAAAGIALASPRTSMITFSAHDDASSIALMFEHGVEAYVLKDDPLFHGRRGDPLRRPPAERARRSHVLEGGTPPPPPFS